MMDLWETPAAEAAAARSALKERPKYLSRFSRTWPAPLADSVDQAYTPTLDLMNLPQFKPTTTERRRKECLRFTGDQRINN